MLFAACSRKALTRLYEYGTIESEFDTYFYVIDPRSSELVNQCKIQ